YKSSHRRTSRRALSRCRIPHDFAANARSCSPHRNPRQARRGTFAAVALAGLRTADVSESGISREILRARKTARLKQSEQRRRSRSSRSSCSRTKGRREGDAIFRSRREKWFHIFTNLRATRDSDGPHKKISRSCEVA